MCHIFERLLLILTFLKNFLLVASFINVPLNKTNRSSQNVSNAFV